MLRLARRFLAESLFKNSAFLVLNLAFSALCGYGSLSLLTHIFSVNDVGLSATATSAGLLITPITLLGTSAALPRYLPTAANRTAMINTVLTAVLLSTLHRLSHLPGAALRQEPLRSRRLDILP